jgi:phosphohistidine phosphatase
MILYLVRHGIAIDRTDPKSPAEADRPLTAEGVRKTRSAALGLRALEAKPDVLITSPYVRAAQTAEIFAEALGFPLDKIRVSEALKPAENPAEIVKELLRLKSKEAICCGHAPHLDSTVAYLCGTRVPFTELKKAGIACLEHAAARGKWMLLWLATPRILRKLGD